MGRSDENSVQLTRVMRASPGAVFSAWTEPAQLERWWTGVGGWIEATADVDLRVGGRYHFSMRDEGGALHGVVGVYTRIAAPEHLGFTWTWENEPAVMRGSEGSLVDVALQDTPGGTQVTLTHGGFANRLVKDMHEEGWNALLTSLFSTLS